MGRANQVFMNKACVFVLVKVLVKSELGITNRVNINSIELRYRQRKKANKRFRPKFIFPTSSGIKMLCKICRSSRSKEQIFLYSNSYRVFIKYCVFRKFKNIFRTLASLGFSSVCAPDFLLGQQNGW